MEVGKDEWEVSLLNRHESITFAYIGYSTKEVNNASFTLVPRKKDWEVIREGVETLSESNSFFDKIITEMQGEDLFLLVGIVVLTQTFVLLYIVLLALLFFRRSARVISRFLGRLEEYLQYRRLRDD